MASKTVRQFDEELSNLFNDRMHKIKTQINPQIGVPPKVTKSKIKKSISRLKKLAEESLLRSKHSKSVLKEYDHKKQWHPKRGKNRGRSNKKRQFKEWYDEHITTKNCVYAFWSVSKCLYIGRTLNGKGRPSSHFDKHWFGNASRLDIYAFDRKRDVPRYECMLTHKNHPTYSKITPASRKYYSRCPICQIQKKVEIEIKVVFRLR